MKTRTTSEQRESLRRRIVDRLIERPNDEWAEIGPMMAAVLLDCDDAIDRVESIENRLSAAYDGVTSAQGYVASALQESRR